MQDLRDPDCLHVYLRHTAEYVGEGWVVCLLFQNGYFRDLWLEHAKLFQQRSLLKNAASNPRLRKGRAALYSKLKNRLDDLTGSKGEQEWDRGNLQYIYYFDGHGTMLVQDNYLPAIVIYIQYYKTDEKTDKYTPDRHILSMQMSILEEAFGFVPDIMNITGSGDGSVKIIC